MDEHDHTEIDREWVEAAKIMAVYFGMVLFVLGVGGACVYFTARALF